MEPEIKSDALIKAQKAFEELKIKSFIDDKNRATVSGIHKETGVSRNNFSKSYIQEYPEWGDLRKDIYDFKKDFKNTNRTPENSKVKKLQKELSDTKKELKSAMSQNLLLIKENSLVNKDGLIVKNKLDDVLSTNQELELQLDKYIEKYGLLG